MSANYEDKRIKPLPGMHTLDHPSMKGQKADYENSVYGIFREFVLPLIPSLSMLVSKRYHEWNGRPSKDINTLIGICILQEMNDWTVKEALHALKCDSFVKYSLGLPDHAPDELVRICEKTYYTFRKRFLEAGGPETAYLRMTHAFLETFKVDTSVVRIDSTHVCSNIKTLSRGGLFRETLSVFLREFMKRSPQWIAELDRGIRDRYDESRKVGYDPYGQASRERRRLMLEAMAADAATLVGQFRHDPRLNAESHFRLLARLVREQCEAVTGGEGGGHAVRLKDPKDIAADSLQSPHDTGATYSGAKKMKGRKLQVAEVCTPARKSGLMAPALNLAIYVKTEGAHESDSNAVESLVKFMKIMKINANVILGDNPYNTGHNRELAEGIGAEIVTSRHGGLKDPSGSGAEAGEPRFTLADFKTDEKGALAECPRGQAARTDMSRRGDACNAHFDRDVCGTCPCKGLCPVRLTSRSASLRYSLSSLAAARNRALNGTPENVAKARQRNGIEGTMSEAKRVQGIGRLRIRGTLRVTAANFLKMLGMNIKRVFNFVIEHRRFCKSS